MSVDMGRPPNNPDPRTGPLALFAAEHRRYRKLVGITQAELADQLGYTSSFVGMVETADRAPSRRYAETVDPLLKAGGGLINCWLLVSCMHVPRWAGPITDLEARATAIRAWEIAAIPGLLRTADYARALASADRPSLTADEVDRDVEALVLRQEILKRPTPAITWIIIDETVLHRQVGGSDTMHAQYKHLLEMADLAHVVIQILPVDAGIHPGRIGTFTILDLDDQPAIVWMDGPGPGRLIDREEHVTECIRRFEYLKAIAQSPATSKKTITTQLE